MNDPGGDSATPDSPDLSILTEKPEPSASQLQRKRFRWIRLPQFRLMDLIWLVAFAAIFIKLHLDHQELVELKAVINGQRSRGKNWSFSQLLGKPNSPRAGDQSSAWASMHQNDANEWVMVEFPKRVAVARVDVYENYNPGAIYRICSVDYRGIETEIFKGVDPTPTTAGRGCSKFSIDSSLATRRIKVYLISDRVPGWNEIDAISLHGKDGSMQWASDAWASSSYGETQDPPSWFWP